MKGKFGLIKWKPNEARKNVQRNMMLCVMLILVFGGCATKINLEVARPPTLNTAGIKRIAIMPFEYTGSRGYGEMAQYATTVATNKIREMDYFTLVDPSQIESLRRSNQSIENHVDALLVGRVTRVGSESDSKQGKYENRDGSVVYYTTYTTKVEVEFNYSLVRARDGSLIGPVSKKGRNSSSSRENYPSAEGLLRAAIDGQLMYIGQDLAPYTAIEKRTFVTDKSGNDALKKEMKDTLALVKAGSYKTALETYLGIYERYKSLAAAENASILYESFGDTQIAANLMQKAFDDTGNPRAKEVLARLNKILQDQATLANEYDDATGQTEKIATFAGGEIQKALPGKAIVWIHNNSSGNAMVGAVVDNITADFIQKGINVVDRQNTALIQAEQKLQMSGTVSDDDFVNIGNAAGANTIVVIGITGTGAMRRLQVRVLDIERGIPILQSDASDKWQL